MFSQRTFLQLFLPFPIILTIYIYMNMHPFIFLRGCYPAKMTVVPHPRWTYLAVLIWTRKIGWMVTSGLMTLLSIFTVTHLLP